ncbi:hypothetical protein LCGC14_1871350 [marine sediment metagenome]|uniref:Uncharacterized protein n=1 Tax=marine sediment metagenome TaxID=412755 RepID=A0A0F9IIY9_9ZZZZ
MSTLVLICYVILNTSPIEQTCHVEDYATLEYRDWIEFCEVHKKDTSNSLANGFDRFGRARRVSVCKQYIGSTP